MCEWEIGTEEIGSSFIPTMYAFKGALGQEPSGTSSTPGILQDMKFMMVSGM